MPTVAKIELFQDEMTAWRRNLHAHPEIAFEETRTADFVAEKLGEFGVEVARGRAKTGGVGAARNGSAGAGKRHACGHDGHTAMLLGAAKYLAATRDFRGTVRFIFQPAEELAGGGRVMVGGGLF